MAELYGIKTRVLQGAAETPVSTSTCVVFVGSAYNSAVDPGKPNRINSYEEYLEHYHNGTAPAALLTLDKAAEYALNRINGAWFVNCKDEATTAECEPADIAAYLDDALAHICLNSSDVPNIVCMPSVQASAAIEALVGCCKGEINDLYYAQGFVDCSQSSDQISNGNPVAANIEAPSTDGCIVACWGDVIMDRLEDSLKTVPASIVMACRRAEQDATNPNNVPYRSIGNLRIDCKGLVVDDVECTCRQDKMNEVVENGIVSLVNKGANTWYSWGDHTAAVTAGAVEDETYRFDSTVAVLYHILNRFAKKWGSVIDSPMSLMLRDCIISEEQDYLNGLKAMGCLVGDPKCEFRPIDNTADTIGQGQFYFTNIATVVPPAKYLELGVMYTDAGLSAYIEG